MLGQRLARERGRKYVGVHELAEAASRILQESGPLQSRGTVSAVSDERTVRYYLSEGLLAPAQERQGTASVFGYLQLLQILVIKKCQAGHMPIRQIREALSGRGIADLERWLGVAGDTAAQNEAMQFLEGLLHKPPPKPASPANISRKKPPVPTSPATTSSAWQRLEVADGLELHIRAGYTLPGDPDEQDRLMRLITVLLAAYAGKK